MNTLHKVMYFCSSRLNPIPTTKLTHLLEPRTRSHLYKHI